MTAGMKALKLGSGIGLSLAVSAALALILCAGAAATPLIQIQRTGAVENANFDIDEKDDYRVDADIAVIDGGMPNPEAFLDIAKRTDCANPDPLGEWEAANGEWKAEYHPPSAAVMEDPKKWWPDEGLNGVGKLGPYGCLEDAGEPYGYQAQPSHGPGVAKIGAAIDGSTTDGSGNGKGIARGARIWSVRARTYGLNFADPKPESTAVELNGGGLKSFSTAFGSVECTGSLKATMAPTAGQLPITAGQLSLAGEYGGSCSGSGLSATVAMKSCHYTLTIASVTGPAPNKGGGTLGVACEKAGEAIELNITNTKTQLSCLAKIGAQAGVKNTTLANTGLGSDEGIELDAKAEGLQYELIGSGCGGLQGTRTDGAISGKTTLLGSRKTEAHVGVLIVGSVEEESDGKEHPRFDAQLEYLTEVGTARLISSLDWVAAHADEIDVVGVWIACGLKGSPLVEELKLNFVSCNETGLKEAIDRVVDKGVVVAVPAGNGGIDSANAVPRNDPDVLTVSNVSDADGKPGGLGGTRICGENGLEQPDDWRKVGHGEGSGSGYGQVVDIAAPTDCGATSGATAEAAAAAAALASQCPADDRAGVEFIEDTLMAEGDTGEISEGGWKDDSGDGWKEPLLNLSDEKVFNPVLKDTATGKLNHEPETECLWRSHQAESDVDSDGRADLVAVNGEAKSAEVFAGTYEGPDDSPAHQGYETTSPTSSLKGQLDPALKDGAGQYTIDTADVDGDRHADLVTAEGGKGVNVYPGNGEGGFGTAVQSLKGMTLSFDGSEGLLEPIAVADVNGDERADLVALFGGTRLVTYPGQADGTFGAAVDAGLANLDSALLDSTNFYFLDVADVDGDGYADLVGMKTTLGTLHVFRGRSDYKFEKGIPAGSANPILDDGVGEEPIGLGDVDRDRRADLLTLDGETLKLRKAKADGSFEEPVVAYAGKVDSSLLDGKGQELVGLLDYSRDGLADLVSVDEAGNVLTYTAQRNFTFAAPVASGGTLKSVRSGGAYEFAAEKPFLRRAGCQSSGCVWQPPVRKFAAAYSFNEGFGTVLHDSAGNHDGTIESATWTKEGKYGSALDFDGVNDLVSIADASDLDLTGSFTIEAWVRPDTLTPYEAPVSKIEEPGGKLSGYLLAGKSNATAKAPIGFVESAGTGPYAEGTTSLPTGSWSHLAFTSDGTTLRLYVNGEQVGSAAAIAAAATTIPLTLGHGVVLNSYFDGKIDEVRIYNEALSKTQIQADRDKPIPTAAYSFNEGFGTVLHDSAGNHDGTIESATWTKEGKYGSALDFDGVNDLVSIADASDLDLTGSFTIEAWVRPDTLGRPVFGKWDNPGGLLSGYNLSTSQTAGNPGGKVANAGSSAVLAAASPLSGSAWSHLALTSDGTTLRFYVNGKLASTQTAIAAGATIANLEIGHNSNTGVYFDGQIDEARIYNAALSESQIQADLEAAL